MQVIKKTIETTGFVNAEHQLLLKDIIPLTSTHVRVIIMATEDDYTDISESEWMMAAAANPAFDFLKNSEEDIYTLTDGKAFL
jgi:diadenosine tetraphosphate (Ap4A) HIT family hydrolase